MLLPVSLIALGFAQEKMEKGKESKRKQRKKDIWLIRIVNIAHNLWSEGGTGKGAISFQQVSSPASGVNRNVLVILQEDEIIYNIRENYKQFALLRLRNPSNKTIFCKKEEENWQFHPFLSSNCSRQFAVRYDEYIPAVTNLYIPLTTT